MKRNHKKEKNKRKGKPKPNRQHKDSVFVDIFSRDKITRHVGVISLYNALHKEKVPENTEVEFLELKNVLYHKYKNDVSFLLNDRIIVLIEHQSTINENMPLRFLLYIVALYELIVDTYKRYFQHLIKIPKPEFYVIYNGIQDYPAQKDLKLSNAFMETNENKDDIPLELIVKVININHPDNENFLEQCELLKGYREFAQIIYEFRERYGEKGYDFGIKYCIEHGILPDYLQRNIKEVLNMLRAKYSYNDEVRAIREEERQEGRKEGRQEGRQEMVDILKTKGYPIAEINDILECLKK
jgi:hypothetical protein